MTDSYQKMPEEGKLNLGISILIQFYTGTVFGLFGIGLFIFKSPIKEHIYVEPLVMLISMIITIPFMLILQKNWLKLKPKEEKVKLLDTKSFILTLLFAEFYRRIGLFDQLRNFLTPNNGAEVFALALPFFAFHFDKTNLVLETSIFLLMLIIFHIFQSQIILFHLVVFYLTMGVIFLTGGILDFRKFSKLSSSH